MEKKTSLWNFNFNIIMIANLVSRIGNVVFDTVLAWWIVSVTGSSRPVGYIMSAPLFAVAVLSPVSGVFSDRWNKKYILIISDFAGGAVSIFVSVMAYFNIINIPALVVSCFILGISSSIFKPTSKSIIPQLVGKEHLLKANSVTTTIAESTRVVGPLFAGILIGIPFIGISGALFFNGLSFIISGVLEIFIEYKKATQVKKRDSVLFSLKEGLRYIYDKKIIRNLLILSSLVNIFLSSFNILLPLYVKDIISKDSGFYSVALTVEAVGGIAITVFFIVFKAIKPTTKLLSLLILLTGLSLALIPIVPNGIFILLCIFGLGIFLGAFNTTFYSYIQLVVDDQYMGRVFSLVYMIATVTMPIAYLIFGYLGNMILKGAFLYSGIAIMLCTIPLFFVREGISDDIIKFNNTGS